MPLDPHPEARFFPPLPFSRKRFQPNRAPLPAVALLSTGTTGTRHNSIFLLTRYAALPLPGVFSRNASVSWISTRILTEGNGMSDANPLRTGSTKRFCLYQTLSLRPLSSSTARNEASVQGQGLFPLTDWTHPSVGTQTMAAFSQPSQIPIFAVSPYGVRPLQILCILFPIVVCMV